MRRVLINIIYTIAFLLILVIGYFIIRKTNIKTDTIPPTIETNVIGSSVIVKASDNVGVYAYAYNTKNEIPDNWYNANNKKEFETTLRIISQGRYYMWVKDEMGNISNTASFDLLCRSGKFNGIDETIYCPYSRINAFGYNWHVLEDREGEITLFMDSGELKELSHCSTKESVLFCYYKNKNDYGSYSWGKSLINEYLNKDFKDTLKDVKYISSSVCNDEGGIKGCINNDGCGGYLSKDVNDLNNFCHSQYISSDIRLLSLSEYNRILEDLGNGDKSWLFGNKRYWTMNTWKYPYYVPSIDIDGSYIVDEKSTSKLDVRPVMVVKR